MPGPTLDEYNAAMAQLASQSGGEYQPVAPEEFMSMDPSVQFMSQPQFAPDPSAAIGPPAPMLSPQDAAIQQFALQLQAKEEEKAAQTQADEASGPDPLADFGARLAPGIEPETPMARYQSVNPYVTQQEAPSARPPTFRPRRGGGGGVGGLMGRMERDARATGLSAQQEADQAAAARDEALDARRAAIEAAGQARQESLQQQAALKRAENEAILDEIKQRESAQNVAQAKREMFMQDYERAQAEADRMLPPRDRRSRQTAAMGALAVALSGIGDAIAASGGTRMNSMQTTLGIIDAAVERDLQAQREAKRDAQGKADRTLHRLDVFDKMASTEQSASLAREAAIRAEYAGYMEAAAKEYEGTAAGQQAIEASQALRQQSEALKAQSADVEAQQALGKAEALQLKRAQMAQQAAAGASPERLLKLEEQQLKNQKLRKELSDDGPGRKLNEAEGKIYRGAQGVAPDRRYIQSVLDSGDLPSFGVRGVSEALVPDRAVGTEAARYRRSIEQMADVILRDKSGAVISDSEIEREVADAFSGDDDRAKQAVRRLTERYDARVRSVGIDPMTGKSGADATKAQAAQGAFRPRR